MPIYEYICHSCGKEFEVLRKFSDTSPTTCQFCGENKVVKKLSLSAFQLKGSNWYRDGYSATPAPASQESKGGGGVDASKTSSDTSTPSNASSNASDTSTPSASSNASDGTSNGSSTKNTPKSAIASTKSDAKGSSPSSQKT